MTDDEMDELIDNATADVSFMADVEKLRAECKRLRAIEVAAKAVDDQMVEYGHMYDADEAADALKAALTAEAPALR